MMHRCFIEPEDLPSECMPLGREEAHYLKDVLRVAPGDLVEAIDGAGNRRRARMEAGGDGGPRLAAVGPVEVAPTPRVTVSLLQAVIKGNRMDWLVEKATELGVATVIPVMAARSVVRLDAAGARRKRERWDRVARGAARQCGRYRFPVIRAPMSLNDALALCREHDLLIGDLKPDCPPLASLLREGGAAARALTLAIGPEGDFDDDEAALLRRAGARSVSFGPHVLRAETAALFGLSVINAAAETASA